ncbi:MULTISPECIES: hypothetical protein [unclassified Arthrobacter]|uniref:hypothetical protein n=1 Tax=unclassified Arthrobacter TaxID=235627 RepID=UPI003395FC10
MTSTHWQNLRCDSEAGCFAPQPLDSIKDSNVNAALATEDISALRALWQAALQYAGEVSAHHAMELVAAVVRAWIRR